MIEINSKIVGVSIASKTADVTSDIEKMETRDVLTEDTERPDNLRGSTYKVKTPLSDHALYITINDIVLNEGTEHETQRPFEIFINTKGVEHFQWQVALTRVLSAVFRKGGDIEFLFGELKSIFDPKGGYFKQGKYMPSLVAEIGDVIERHIKSISNKYSKIEDLPKPSSGATITKVSNATLCSKCNEFAVYLMDGCPTCTNCGDSKCGG